MKRIAGLLLLTLLIVSPQAAHGQSNAFEGTWTMDTSRSASSAPGQQNRILEAAQVIRTLGREVHIESTRNGRRQLVRYQTIEAKQPEPVGTSGANSGDGTIEKWEGAELITSTPIQVSGEMTTLSERRYLSPDGQEMTVEWSIRVEHSYRSSDVVKDVYLRSR